MRGRWDIGDLTGLNSSVKGILPYLRHRVRIRCSSRICGSPAWGTYLWKTRGRRRGLTPEKGMCKVILVVKPAIGQSALSDMSMIMIVIRGYSSGMNGGEGEKEEEREEDHTSETGEGQHSEETSWQGECPRVAMPGGRRPFKSMLVRASDQRTMEARRGGAISKELFPQFTQDRVAGSRPCLSSVINLSYFRSPTYQHTRPFKLALLPPLLIGLFDSLCLLLAHPRASEL